jgi:outer membrane lipoprotein
VIIQTMTQTNRTCFEVMGLSLDSNAQPQSNDQSLGRFIACAKGFYDPALYAAGRELTFTGSIEGTEKQKIGEYDYQFPRLVVDAVHLWPKRSNIVYVPYYDPFWDPFWPYYYRPYPYHRR